MRTQILVWLIAAVFAGFAHSAATGQETVKIGLIVPLTGGQASTGKQLDNAVKLYMQQNGNSVAGKRIEVIVRDDGAIPDNTKRITQELIVNDKVQIIAGFGITPAALAAAPLATQAKIPEIVMLAGASIVTERSPYIVRTSFTLAQSAVIIGDWAAKSGIKRVATLTSDYAPGNDAPQFFKARFTAAGGEIAEEVKVPLMNPDFAPFLQRMKDAKPDAMFVFVPGGQGGNFMKQFSSAVSTRPASGSSVRATSWTMICSTTWEMSRSVPSPRTCIRRPILRR
jgi:branched-chain amino acid transport system substrate-binding protein